VIAGRASRPLSLGRAADRRKLEGQLAEVRGKVAQTNQLIAETQDRLQSYEERARLGSQDLLRLRGEEERLRGSVEATRSRRLQLQQELGWRLHQRQDLQADLDRQDSEATRHAAEQQDVLIRLKERGAMPLSDEARQQEESREAVTQEVSRWRTQAALLAQALADLKATSRGRARPASGGPDGGT
jgi:chromosome segregation ATPase